MGLIYQQENNFTRGLECLDKRFGKPSIRELIIMFGYSGIGKTEYSFFTARRNAEAGNKVQYYSLELPEYDMKQRICLARAGVSKFEFQTGRFTQEQKEIMDAVWDDLESITNLQIIGPEDKTVEKLVELIRDGYSKGYRMFYIDNLDKITTRYGGDNENSRYQYVTSKLQDLKNELNICIVLIHHAKKVYNSTQVMARAGIEGLRGSQKIVDNSTQVFEVFRDLDPDMPELHKLTQIIQLKDTFGGPKGYQMLEFQRGEYIEYIKPEDKKQNKSGI